ncbi:uncharacterized protein LTR77_009028 [Saxophila tyrrhenica]|uniref:Allergen n=1 Tax=Saxophila tyrrhenica TaxID=1690608 RepID=A0AAV9P290_9PEZI|nr:hypothetical protein LTR77_009028 [Saxophila tyrrhenica]
MVSHESQTAMENASKAVKEFMIKNGHRDTSIYEYVRPAVYHETRTRTERAEVITVLDQERHQSHFHTSIQPVTDEETLEPQHHERIHPVEKHVFEHDDREEVKHRLDAEQAKFFDNVEIVEGEKTREVQQSLEGSHLHHHVREIIQPIVTKRKSLALFSETGAIFDTDGGL